MSYAIRTASGGVEKQIANLPRGARDRVIARIRDLGNNPRPPGCRKLAGELKGSWRIRVGAYRVFYDVDDQERVVVVTWVGLRREAYR